MDWEDGNLQRLDSGSAGRRAGKKERYKKDQVQVKLKMFILSHKNTGQDVQEGVPLSLSMRGKWIFPESSNFSNTYLGTCRVSLAAQAVNFWSFLMSGIFLVSQRPSPKGLPHLNQPQLPSLGLDRAHDISSLSNSGVADGWRNNTVSH